MASSFDGLGPSAPLGPLKLEYNNDVMKLKKYFVQAKTQIINSLSKKVKKLKSHKATDALKEKIDKKVDSIVAEILMLKKLKYNEVANFAMVNNEELKKLMNTPVVTEEKVMAKMIAHKALKSKLDNVKNKFMIVPTLELLEPNPKKVRQKKIKQRRKAKENSSQAKNKSDTVNSTNMDNDSENDDVFSSKDEQEDSDGSGVNESLDIKTVKKSIVSKIPKMARTKNVSVTSTSDFSVTSLNDNHMEDFDDTIDLQIAPIRKSKDVKNSRRKSDISFDDDDDDNIDKISPESLVSIKNNKKSKINKKLSDSEINMILDKKSKNSSEDLSSDYDNDMNENISKSISKKKSKISDKIKNFIDLDKVPSEEPIEKTVDSFFVTESGDRYMTMALPRAPDKLDEENFSVGENRKMRRAALFGNEVLKPKKQKSSNPIKRNYSQMSNTENNEDNQSSSRFKKNFDKPAKNGLRDQIIPEVTEKLHPSWEAKKQKSAIVNFQGSKIVFDD